MAPRRSADNPFQNRIILLGLTGSIAIYKSCDLVRRLKELGARVRCLMSRGAQSFVAPLTFGALSGEPVATDIWDSNLWKAAHLEHAERADLFLIAPASANSIAKLAQGAADDVITATALATRAPILVAPAMHEAMWLHPLTQRNVRQLKEARYSFVGPVQGPLLSKDRGWGRLAETEEILAAAGKLIRKSSRS